MNLNQALERLNHYLREVDFKEVRRDLIHEFRRGEVDESNLAKVVEEILISYHE